MVNVKYWLRHRPGCTFHDAPWQMNRLPAFYRGYEVTGGELPDGSFALRCTCGATALYRENELIGDAPAAEPSRPLTSLQRQAIKQYPAALDYVRRTYAKATDKALADRLGIDRGTLARYRRAGILPPD